MRKIILLFLFTVLSFSCSSSDDEKMLNPFIGNSFTAKDPIASIIYGAGATETIEFLSEKNCQRIQFRPGSVFSPNIVTQGTYVFSGNEVTWTIEGSSRTANLSGSTLISTIVINGNPIIYIKN
jgi:hypothetical protein